MSNKITGSIQEGKPIPSSSSEIGMRVEKEIREEKYLDLNNNSERTAASSARGEEERIKSRHCSERVFFLPARADSRRKKP